MEAPSTTPLLDEDDHWQIVSQIRRAEFAGQQVTGRENALNEPRNRKTEQSPTNEVHFGSLDDDDKVMEVVDEVPPEAKDWEEDTTLTKVSAKVFIPSQNTMCVEDNQHASKLFETSFTFQEANSHEIFMSDEGSFDGPNLQRICAIVCNNARGKCVNHRWSTRSQDHA